MKALHKLYTSFLVLLAAATDREMAKMLQYLKEENPSRNTVKKILRAEGPDPGPRWHQASLRRRSYDQSQFSVGRAAAAT